MNGIRFTISGLVASLVLSIALGAIPVRAQIPDEFTNLEVLPTDISKGELVSLMRSFAAGLGVRCNHCHVGEPSGDLRGMDFASDEKTEKGIARGMMAMVSEINGSLIPKTNIENPAQVNCMTCHHGVTRPVSLVQLMKEEYEERGVAAAVDNYRALKDKYYGSASYDFTSRTLGEVAEWLAQERESPDDAIAIAEFLLEQDPNDASSYALLGRILAGAGRKEDAIRNLEKAMELNPDDRWTARLLERVRTEE
jgi:hypothetical protein